MRKYFPILAFLICSPLLATTYYVDNCVTVGNDSNNGTSTATPWLTVAKVNGSSFSAGDSILFESTCTWHEQLTVPSSGSAGSPITFGVYGTGAAPILDGADVFSSWTTEATSGSWTLANNKGEAGAGAASTDAFANPLTNGSLIVVHVWRQAAPTTPTDTAGNTYSDCGSGSVIFHTDYRIQCFYTINTHTTSSNVVTSTSALNIIASEWTGNAASSPVDVFHSTASGTTLSTDGADNMTSGAATTNVNGDLIIGNWSTYTGAAASGTGFTALAGVNGHPYAEYKVQTTAGSIAATATRDANDFYAMIMTAFKVSTSATLYYSAASTQPNQVFVDNVRQTLAASKLALTNGTWWWDSGNSRIYLYTNPAGHTVKASQRSYGIYANTKSYLTISGIETDNANTFGTYVTLGAEGILVTNMVATYNGSIGFRLDTDTNATISYSTAAYNNSDGFSILASPTALADHLIAHHNCLDATVAQCAGIKFDDSATGNWPGTPKTAINNVVQYSSVYNNGVAVCCGHGVGIYADTIGDGWTVRYNYIHDNQANGIYSEKQSASLIYGNVVANNVGQSGDVLGGIVLYMSCSAAGCVTTNNVVTGNTVYGNFGHAIRNLAQSITNACTNSTVSNNIALGSTYTQLDVEGGCENVTYGSGNVYTYNDFGAAASNFLVWGTGNLYSTYATWEAATGNCGTTGCSHSTQTTPTFYNTGANDYWLAIGSVGAGAGTDLGSPYNIGLMPASSWPSSVVTFLQSSPPTLGAYDYIVPNSAHASIF
jgi:hypothetical protein